ncbi:hypothetical protein [Limnoraphis robusta]|uniref:Uncharacterized protein n=1 Tax=Limnoraphis robusta CS-951 TaxID=1637645 RepID=A0A0F5Y9C6_9CYAN|nr:hypothetical protein [Limnoraphis robusta]KKD35464.1 hypothetical protein WN50_25185 [Limnoraphis robusta CS-951]
MGETSSDNTVEDTAVVDVGETTEPEDSMRELAVDDRSKNEQPAIIGKVVNNKVAIKDVFLIEPL